MDGEYVKEMERLANEGVQIEGKDGRLYSSLDMKPVLFNPRPDAIAVQNLTAISDYLKTNRDSRQQYYPIFNTISLNLAKNKQRVLCKLLIFRYRQLSFGVILFCSAIIVIIPPCTLARSALSSQHVYTSHPHQQFRYRRTLLHLSTGQKRAGRRLYASIHFTEPGAALRY